jgi:hypothetical protein
MISIAAMLITSIPLVSLVKETLEFILDQCKELGNHVQNCESIIQTQDQHIYPSSQTLINQVHPNLSSGQTFPNLEVSEIDSIPPLIYPLLEPFPYSDPFPMVNAFFFTLTVSQIHLTRPHRIVHISSWTDVLFILPVYARLEDRPLSYI